MILFTSGDIRKLIDLPGTTLTEWCFKGIVHPISGGVGTGNHRQWSLMQAVGFVVAEEIRRSERSCAVSFVGKTVEVFGNVSEQWLRRKIKEDGRHYVGPHQGQPLLGGDARYGHPDALAALKRVLAYAKTKDTR